METFILSCLRYSDLQTYWSFWGPPFIYFESGVHPLQFPCFVPSACLLKNSMQTPALGPISDCCSQFLNLFEMPGLLKQIQSWWELQRRGRFRADMYSSCMHGYNVLPMQNLHGLGGRAPKCSRSFSSFFFLFSFPPQCSSSIKERKNITSVSSVLKGLPPCQPS